MTTKRTKKTKNKARLCFLIPLCLVLITFLTITIGNYWVQIVQKYQEKTSLSSKITVLKDKESELKVDVDKLQDPDYIARYAREKYMYSKDGEFIIRIPEGEEK